MMTDDRIYRKLESMDDRARKFEIQVTRELSALLSGFNDMTRRIEVVEALETRVAAMENRFERLDTRAAKDYKNKFTAMGASAGVGGALLYLIEYVVKHISNG